MKSLDNMSPHEGFENLRNDLMELHTLTKEKLNNDNWPQIVKLTGHIYQCVHRLEKHLKAPFKRNILGIVEDFQDYNLDSAPSERHDFQQYLQKNLNQVIHDLDHALLKRKAA